jgi:hypothetical protein
MSDYQKRQHRRTVLALRCGKVKCKTTAWRREWVETSRETGKSTDQYSYWRGMSLWCRQIRSSRTHKKWATMIDVSTSPHVHRWHNWWREQRRNHIWYLMGAWTTLVRVRVGWGSEWIGTSDEEFEEVGVGFDEVFEELLEPFGKGWGLSWGWSDGVPDGVPPRSEDADVRSGVFPPRSGSGGVIESSIGKSRCEDRMVSLPRRRIFAARGMLSLPK